MTIGAISFQPYVYNVNAISPASMNRVSGISDDVLDKKTDYSGLTEAENENPLKKGQTLNFQDMLAMQMQRGRNNAARIMKPAQEEAGEKEQTETATAQFGREQNADAIQLEKTETAASAQTAAYEGNGSTGNDISNYRMQQAINAYEMFMTA